MFNIIILIIILFSLSLIFKNNNENIFFLNKEYTNILKGIAIILVLLNHIGQAYSEHIVEPLGTIGVCIFLVLSAFGINESFKRKGKKNYVRNRIVRVLIPYWIISIVCGAIRQEKVSCIIQYIFLLKLPTPIFWYIRLIVYWYIVYYISQKFNNQKNRYIFIFLMSFLISFIYFENKVYIYQVLSFPLGLLLSDNVAMIKRYVESHFNKIIIYSFCISILAIILKKIPYIDARTYGFLDISIGIILDISSTILVAMLLQKFNYLKIYNLYKKIGQVSYEIYLIHPLFLFMIIKNNSLINMFLFIIIIVIFSFVFNLFNKILGKLCNQVNTQ